MAEIKPGTGALHPVEKTKPNSPDFKGQVVTEDGKKIEIAAWFNNYKASNGEYLRLKLTSVVSTDPGYDPKLK